MSRLESVAKAGYYPTPPSVVERAAALIRPAHQTGRQAVRLLDPCCGTGAAHGSFSCLWLNPPYDHDDEAKRLEHAFLTTMSRALCPGGLLVLIVPQRRLAVSARYLAGHYTRLACYRFPDAEYASFSQVVLLAVKRDGAVGEAQWRTRIEAWAAEPLPELPPAGSAEPLYDLPALPAGPVLFASQFFDPEVAAQQARQSGLWASPALAERLWPAEERPVRPLTPLRRGHPGGALAGRFLHTTPPAAG